MDLPQGYLTLIALQHRQQALVYTNVLLLRLNHPDPLLAHLVHNTKYVYHIGVVYALQDAVQGDQSA